MYLNSPTRHSSFYNPSSCLSGEKTWPAINLTETEPWRKATCSFPLRACQPVSPPVTPSGFLFRSFQCGETELRFCWCMERSKVEQEGVFLRAGSPPAFREGWNVGVKVMVQRQWPRRPAAQAFTKAFFKQLESKSSYWLKTEYITEKPKRGC